METSSYCQEVFLVNVDSQNICNHYEGCEIEFHIIFTPFHLRMRIEYGDKMKAKHIYRNYCFFI